MAGPIPIGAIIEMPKPSLFEQLKEELAKLLPGLAQELELDRLSAMLSALMYSDNPFDRAMAQHLQSRLTMHIMGKIDPKEKQIVPPSQPGVATW